MQALQRYARFYNLKVDAEVEQEELAALVARHFDGSLEVEEHESISSFVQRVRNGERGGSKRSLDKERRAAAAAEKKRKKSSSRKRQRDASVSVGAGGGPISGGAGHNGHHGASANGHGSSGSGAASAGSHHHHAGSSASSGHHEKASNSNSSTSSSSGNAGKTSGKRGGGKKKEDNEDNELYCICNLPSYGNMIACDGKKCPNPSQWYHLECVGLADGRHPDTWLCPECDPKGFAAFQSKKKKTKHRSKSPGAK